MPPTSVYYALLGLALATVVHWWLLNHREQSPRWARRTAAALVGLATVAVAGWLFARPLPQGLNQASLALHPDIRHAEDVHGLPAGSRVIVRGQLSGNPLVEVPEWSSNDPMPDFIAYRVYAFQGYNQPDESIAFHFPELNLRLEGGGAVTLAPAPETAVNAPDNQRRPRVVSFERYYNTSPKIFGYTNNSQVTVIADVLEDGRLLPVRYVYDRYWYDLPGWDAWHIVRSLGLGFGGLVLFLLALVAELPPPPDENENTAPMPDTA